MAAHRTEFIIFEHRYVVLGPNPANLECVYDHKISYVFMGSVNICSLYTP